MGRKSIPMTGKKKPLLLVEVSSLFSKDQEPYKAAQPALEKLFNAGWHIQFWSESPRKDFTQISGRMIESGLITYHCDQKNPVIFLEHREKPGESKSLFFKKQQNAPFLDRALFIEDDPRAVEEIKAQHPKAQLELAPRVWVKFLAVKVSYLEDLIRQGNLFHLSI
jgi:hypothetical protein